MCNKFTRQLESTVSLVQAAICMKQELDESETTTRTGQYALRRIVKSPLAACPSFCCSCKICYTSAFRRHASPETAESGELRDSKIDVLL